MGVAGETGAQAAASSRSESARVGFMDVAAEVVWIVESDSE
jgi:hypothetical protein